MNELQNTAETWDSLTSALAAIRLTTRNLRNSNCLKHILDCFLVIPVFGTHNLSFLYPQLSCSGAVHCRAETKCVTNRENLCIFIVFVTLVTISHIWPYSHHYAIYLQSYLLLHACPLTHSKTFSSPCCNNIPLRLSIWSRVAIILMDMSLLGHFYEISLNDCSQSPADRHSPFVA